MMSWILLVSSALGGYLTPGQTPTPNPEDRMRAHQEAVSTFENLHFFSEGRGMILAPDIIKFYDFVTSPKNKNTRQKNWQNRALNRRWGLNVENDKAVGIFSVPYKDMNVGVVGCVACHSGRAAGRFIVGLGNKNIDVLKLAKDKRFVEKIWDLIPELPKSPEYQQVKESAHNFGEYLANDRIGNLVQGLVPVSFIRGWFYRYEGIPIPKDMKRGQVKVAHLWGYGVKRHVGQFSDGFGNGTLPGWAIAVELAAGQTPQAVRNYVERVETAEDILGNILPPRYPFTIERPLAKRGRALFEVTCAKCHGTYERDTAGLPIYKEPKFIPIGRVKTDSDRIDGNTPEFEALVDRNPLNDILQVNWMKRGYFAPRLDGIWARFPYLHNSSVPTVRDLLKPARLRPKAFSLAHSGSEERFDEADLGLKATRTGKKYRRILRRAKAGARDHYYSRRVGLSNQGHEFYVDLPDSDKDALIEYLKSL